MSTVELGLAVVPGSAENDHGRRVDRSLFSIALVARLVVLGVVLGISGLTLPALLEATDVPSYVVVARALFEGAVLPPDSWHTRVFPGWSALIGPPGLVFGYAWSAVVLGIVAAAAVPVAYRRCGGSSQGAWLLVWMSPAFVLCSAFGMSEPANLLLILASYLLLQRKHPLAAGLVMGAAGLFRPASVFACLGGVFLLPATGRGIAFVRYVVGCGLVAGLLLPFNRVEYGDWLHQLGMYGHAANIPVTALVQLGYDADNAPHWGWPFASLIAGALRLPVPAWKLGYIAANVAMVIIALAIALRRLGDGSAVALDRAMAAWLVGNSLFIFCTGPYWGFHSFDRYAVWAMPATVHFLAIGVRLPAWLQGAGIVASTVVATLGAAGHL